ncbi:MULTISPECIES: hypothetical protein [unclassified Methanoculleus]|uniref:hypothetical protein n=1 Tax=unclassified Methanoculleus TaxID=2619537 RepID=UPI0025D0A202|nr:MULTISPECIES: hypothetical protein [unclassified Methanoculleus]MCK9320203.1 hypothetical protein [Methanoculleus sp.]MDD2253504.1 hypothetical protein [Methanoculleus sp.]MDD2788384.1 hypothetical protein [Methanoculleus sp.]MDD3215674.1 hypothetical protein [Methanoculleus sp.]MDD4313406.1 hypothetical protein [Methanoculleus sp.]
MKRNKIFRTCAVAVIGLLLVCMAAVPVGAENDLPHVMPVDGNLTRVTPVDVGLTPIVSVDGNLTRVIPVDGGSLVIDEGGGVDCTADAGSWFVENHTPGLVYRFIVECEYVDTNSAIGGTAEFRLEGPDGTVDAWTIDDTLLLNDNWKGTLSVDFMPEGPGAYHWETACNKGGESTSSRGDLVFR